MQAEAVIRYKGGGTASAEEIIRYDLGINAGYRKFLSAYDWSFLTPRYTLTLNAPYSTGTIAATDGVVTLTTGTFPSWAASGELIIDGEHYTVATRDSDTQVTLDDTSLDVDAGSSYVLTQTTYAMPSDFAWVVGNYVTFEPRGNYSSMGSAVLSSEAAVRRARQDCYEREGRPWLFATFPQTFGSAATESSRWNMEFGPVYPDQLYRVTFRYRREAALLDGTNIYPLGGAVHAETIRYAMLSELERLLNDTDSEFESLYQQKLLTSIEHDQRRHGSPNLGYNGDRSDDVHGEKSVWRGRYRPATSVEYTSL